jgi:hypothetical protein
LVFTETILYAWSEWQAWHGFVNTVFVSGIILIIMTISCLTTSAYLLVKNKILQAGIYLLIIALTVLITRNFLPLEMMIKAYFFSIYPQFCPTNRSNIKNSFICYMYDENRIGGKKEMLVIDPSGSMQHPPSQWSQETKDIFGFSNIPGHFSDDDCHFKNTRHMVKHIFWVSDDCWKINQ